MTARRSAEGMALILVLWLVASLSLVVLAGASSVRQQTQSVGVELDRMRSEALLDGALQIGLQNLMADKRDPKDNRSGYRLLRMPLGSSVVWMEVIPASGLVDVNVASDSLLQALLERVGGLSSGDATIMASRIRDFIDPDDTPGGLGGAEAPQYRAAGKTVMPRNSALTDLSELKFVLGMTSELYDIIAPYLGINGQQRIEADSAPPALIDALTGQRGLGAQIQKSPPEMRAGLLQSGLAAEFFSAGRSGGGQAIKVRAYLQGDGERWWQREAWVDLSERPDTLTPWTTLSLEPTRRVNKPEQEFNP